MPDANGLPTLPELRSGLAVRISDLVRAQFGEPIEADGECDNCLAKNLEVWESLNIDGDWIALCARCIHETHAP